MTLISPPKTDNTSTARLNVALLLLARGLWRSICGGGFVRVQLLFYQVIKTFFLIGREHVAKLLFDVLIFIVNVRRYLVPQVPNTVLAVADDLFDTRSLVG